MTDDAPLGCGRARASRQAACSTQSVTGLSNSLSSDDVEELAGREQAAPRVLPAQQRLVADGPAVVQPDDRLVVQRELVLARGRAPTSARSCSWSAAECSVALASYRCQEPRSCTFASYMAASAWASSSSALTVGAAPSAGDAELTARA